MDHIHNIIDGDLHFKIDHITRKIASESDKVILVQHDHNSNRISFDMPRYIDGHDMTECDKVEIHYLNLSANKKESHPGIYKVTDLEPSAADDNTVTFSWLVSENATQYTGLLIFAVHFTCMNEDGDNYRWSTMLYDNPGICVGESIYNSEVITRQYVDILEQWRKEIYDIIGSGGGGSGGAEVTTESIKEALGYTPAKQSDVDDLRQEVDDKQQKGDYALKSEVPKNASDIGAESSGAVNGHNTSDAAHSDIRLLIEELSTRLNVALNSTDADLDQASEFVAYMKANRTLIESITTNKVSVADIIDNLKTSVSNKPLSAKQGVELKKLIDAVQTALNGIKVPTKTSDLTNDSNFVTEAALAGKGFAKQSDVNDLSAEIIDFAVTPQMYGAVGDGVTDDTQALKNALAENNAVFLPKGTYLITQPIDLTDGKSLYSRNQEGAIKYTGSESVILLGRRSRVNGIRIFVSNANVKQVFNTDNRIFDNSAGYVMSDVDDIEVFFNTSNPTTTIINIVASNKDYIGTAGFHGQNYSNIKVTGQVRIGYGIKICVSFDDDVAKAIPWITNIKFDHIWLGCPECGIKIYRENNSGKTLNHSSIVRAEHMMFTDVATQCTTDGHTKKFYDVEWCMAEFINCQPWDYHHVINRGEKYNVIREGALLSEINARRSPINCAEFPSVTNTTPSENPSYFIDTYFDFLSLVGGDKGYDYADMKFRKLYSQIGMNEDTVASITQNIIDENLTSIYANIMADARTVVKSQQRWSSSGNSWSSNTGIDTLIIPIKAGLNLIRFKGNYTLSEAYRGVYFSNDLVSFTLLAEHENITVKTENGEFLYLQVNNAGGYAYLTIPFMHTGVTMNKDNMIVTINEIIGSGSFKYIGDHIYDGECHVTAEEKQTWNNKSDFSGDYNDLKNKPTIPDGVDLESNAETWTFTLKDGSTVTKKVVVA